MLSVNLQFLLNILDILDMKVWSLKKKVSVCDSILGGIAFFGCQKSKSRAFFSGRDEGVCLKNSIFCKNIYVRGGQ